jgi:N-methylhydantoinase A
MPARRDTFPSVTILGVDVGGTFTDAVLLSDAKLRTAKVPSAARQEESVLAAAAAVGAEGVDRFTHGTTVATNALLERKGARTAFVATAGFEHLLHLRRQNRAHLYRLCAAHPEPLVPLERCHGVRERIGPDGVIEPLELESLPELGDDVEAVAVCLLFSFRDATHERVVAEELRRRLPRARVVASHEVAPEVREYERASTTAIDAYLGPAVARYLEALGTASVEAGLPKPLVMRSSGGLATLEEAAAHPAVALVSGPAGGVVGAARVAGVEDALTLDMGGTSTDVCLIRGGEVERSAEREVAGFPLRLPMVDLQTVGAGGGSIVWRDAGGALRVGPESAGADPGPACYGRGGTAPTLTDACLLIGILDPDGFAGGELKLDPELARRAFESLETSLRFEQRVSYAYRIAVANIAEEVTNVAVRHGVDPRDFTVVAYGAAGPMLLPASLELLHVKRVIVPPHPGLFSALGLLSGDLVYYDSRSAYLLLTPEAAPTVAAVFDEMERGLRARARLGENGVAVRRSFDGRLFGQSWETPFVPVPDGPITEQTIGELVERFHDEYERRYGNRFPYVPVEGVSYRVELVAPAEKVELSAWSEAEPASPRRTVELRYLADELLVADEYAREELPVGARIDGPAIVREALSTTYVCPGQTATVGRFGELRIEAA